MYPMDTKDSPTAMLEPSQDVEVSVEAKAVEKESEEEEEESRTLSAGETDSESDEEDEFVVNSTRFPQCFHIPSGYEGRLGTLLASNDGRRIFVGTDTGDIRMFDLAFINKGLHPYKVTHSVDHQAVTHLSLSSCGSFLLAVSTSSSMKVINVQSGRTEFETVKGDMYIKNSANTYGHQHHVRHAVWHPFDSERFASASQDGTIRLWHLQQTLHGIDQKLPQNVVFRMPDERGRSTGSTVSCNTVAWSPTTAKYVINGSTGGDVGIWDDRLDGARNRPAHLVVGCHDRASGGVMNVQMLQDEMRFVTRGSQDDPEECVKLWDIRKTSGYAKKLTPVSVLNDVIPRTGGYLNPRFQLSYSGKYLSILEGGKGKGALGGVRVFETENFERGPVASYPPGYFGDGKSPVDLCYIYDNKQVVALLDDGSIVFQVHPKLSTRGAMQMKQFPVAKQWIWDGKLNGRPDCEHKFLSAPINDDERAGRIRNDLIVNPEDPSTLPIEYKIGRSGDIIRRKRDEIIELKKGMERVPRQLESHSKMNPFKRGRGGGDVEEDHRKKAMLDLSEGRTQFFGKPN